MSISTKPPRDSKGRFIQYDNPHEAQDREQEAQIASLQHDNVRLAEEIRLCKQGCQSAQADLRAVREELTLATNNIERLKARHAEDTRRIAAAEQSVGNLREDNAALIDLADSLQVERDRYAHQVAALQTRLEAISKRRWWARLFGRVEVEA